MKENIETVGGSSITNGLITVAVCVIIILGIILVFTIVPLIGSTAEISVDYGSATFASGTLSYSGNINAGERVNISTYTFEYTANGIVSPGNIPVNISTNPTNQTDAINALIVAIQNNASVSSLLRVSAS